MIRKDTFTDDIDKLWFGIEVYKKGPFKLSVKIEEEVSYVDKKNDSSTITITKTNKYFNKMLWVK